MARPDDDATQRLSADDLARLTGLRAGDVLADRYRLRDELGRGGMGVVFRARDTTLDREVAVKVLPPDRVDAENRQRLLAEARAAASLNHPGIVAVYDAGEHQGHPYVVMELVEGPNLRDHMSDDVERALDLVRQVLDALSHAHGAGLVHRDLKPENLLLLETAEGTRVKIADLGLAVSPAGTRISGEGFLAGTAGYMAPEQALGETVDERTDLYAVGVMLYELLTGRRPFTGDDALAVISQHVNAPVLPPRTYRSDLAPQLESVVLRLLAKEPDRRFARASEVASALERIPSDAVPAEPTSDVVLLLQELVRGRLVGRDKPLEELRGLWHRSREGGAHLALVSGEPGAGKTRLARELAVYARVEGALVLEGGCYEYEAATPYLPFAEALRRWVHASEEAALEVARETAPELARLAPELGQRLGPFPEASALPAHEERLRLFDHVARFLGAIARRQGLVVFIDDLQWADKGTLGLLHYLLRNLRDERVLFLATYRETDLDRAHPLAAALVDWNRERLATRIALGRFTLEETGAQIATLLNQETVGGDFAEAVFRETEGNPFFVEEVMKALIEQGSIYRERGEWWRKEFDEFAIPQGVKATIGNRLDRVGEDVVGVLRAAAVLGKSFGFDELVAVTPEGEDAALDALDEAAAAQLVIPSGADAFVFTHDKIREVLYEELNPIRRRRLHLRAAQGLEALRERSSSVKVEDLAHHFMEGGELEKGKDYALEAAREAEHLFAMDEAADLYRRAFECAEGLGLPADAMAGLRLATANALAAGGELIAAAAEYEKGLELAEDPALRVDLACRLGGVYGASGNPRGLDLVTGALETIDVERQPRDAARALAVKGRFHHYRGEHGRAAEVLLDAERLLREASLPHEPEHLGFLAGAYQHLGEFAESDRWARKAQELHGHHRSVFGNLIGYEFLAENAANQGNWNQVEEFTQAEIEGAREVHSGERLGWGTWVQGLGRVYLGRMDDAEDNFARADALARRIGDVRLDLLQRLTTGKALALRGNFEEALRIQQAVQEAADEAKLLFHQVEARRYRSVTASYRGDWEAIPPLAAEARTLRGDSDGVVNRTLFAPLEAEGLFETGAIDLAGERADEAIDLGERHCMFESRDEALRVRGLIHAARGDLEAAETDLAAALAGHEARASELSRVLTLRSRARVREAAGRTDEARADRERAASLARDCGFTALG